MAALPKTSQEHLRALLPDLHIFALKHASTEPASKERKHILLWLMMSHAK
jgi:hypothetical protein